MRSAPSAEFGRPARRAQGPRYIAAVVAVAALTIGLFWVYLLPSRTQLITHFAPA